MNQTPIILYGTNKLDILLAVSVISKWVDKECQCIRAGKVSEMKAQTDISNRDIIIVGHLFDRADMIELINTARSILFITNKQGQYDTVSKFLEIEQVSEMLGITFDADKSLSLLAWSKLFPNSLPPLVLQYIQDAYFNTYAMQGSHDVRAALAQRSTRPEHLDELLNFDSRDISKLIEIGRPISRERFRLANICVRETTRVLNLRALGSSYSTAVKLINVPYALAPECAHIVADPIVMFYYDDATHRNFELHNRGDKIDAGEIARTYGGSGDATFARFKVSREDDLAKI